MQNSSTDVKITPRLIKQFVTVHGYRFIDIVKDTRKVEHWENLPHTGLNIPCWQTYITMDELTHILPSNLIPDFITFANKV